VRSPIWQLAMKHRVALPLHPEYRTLPMVWYVPPLSPVMNMIEGEGAEADPDDVFPAIDSLRIPVQFLANLLSAGDEDVIRDVLKRLAAMRSYMRTKTVGGAPDPALAEAVGMSAHEVEEMYRLLGLAKSIDRFVIPTTHAEVGGLLDEHQGACGFTDPAGPGPCGALESAEYGDRVAAFHLGTRDEVAHATATPPPQPATRGGDGCGGGGCTCGDVAPGVA
jgi:nitrate reductase beta subunit